MHALLLYNPFAGRPSRGRGRLEELVACLSRLGIDAELHEAAPLSVLQLLPRTVGKELLIVYGGDGTVHLALDLAVKSGLPLGLIPGGTANVLAEELGLPRDEIRAAEILSRDRRRKMFLGQCNGTYFHLMMGVGVDAYLLSRVGQPAKRTFGLGAFWMTGLTKFWTYGLPRFQVLVDDQEYSATFAVVANAQRYGGLFRVAPRASVFEPGLDVCLFTSNRHLRFFNYLWRARTGRHLELPDVRYFKADSVVIRGNPVIPVQVDGEVWGRLPASASVAADTVEIFVP